MKQLLFAAALLLFCGCGYQIGQLGHPQIKSIAVEPVANETLQYDASGHIRSVICEVITTDGTLKLTHLSKADCILYAKIKSITFSQSSWSSIEDEDKFLPIQWTANVSVEYSVVVPGQVEPLIKSRTVTGTAKFMTAPDLEGGRVNGVRSAMYEAAKDIVHGIAEAW